MGDTVNIREEYNLLLQDIAYRAWLFNTGLYETYDIVMISDYYK